MRRSGLVQMRVEMHTAAASTVMISYIIMSSFRVGPRVSLKRLLQQLRIFINRNLAILCDVHKHDDTIKLPARTSEQRICRTDIDELRLS